MDLEPESVRGHTVVAVPATGVNSVAIAALARDLGKPGSACAFCPGYKARPLAGDPWLRAHNCRWSKTRGLAPTTQCEGAVRYVTAEIWPIVQLRLP